MSLDLYHRWLGITAKDQPPNHYRLLEIDLFESDLQVVVTAANRQMALLQRRAASQIVALPQELLNEIAAARQCLLDPEKKSKYDAELRQSLTESPPAAPKPGDSATGFDFDAIVEASPPTRLVAVRRPNRFQRFNPWHGAVAIAAAVGLLLSIGAIVSLRGRSSQLDRSSPVPNLTKAATPSNADEPKPRPALPSIRLSVSDLTEWVVHSPKKPLDELMEYDKANDCARFLQDAAVFNTRLTKYERYTLTFQYRRTNAAWGKVYLQPECGLAFGSSASGTGALDAYGGKTFKPLAGQRALIGADNSVRILPIEETEKPAGLWNDVRVERDLKRWTVIMNDRTIQKADCSVAQPDPFSVQGGVGFEFRNIEAAPLP